MMVKNSVEKYILDKLEREKLLFVFIDPIDYESPEHAIHAGVAAAEGGAAAVLVGGSIAVQGELLDSVVKQIKEGIAAFNVPLILFPGNIATLSRYADAIYFMSLLNSRSTYWISQAQMLGAPVIKSLGIEPLPIGYIIAEPGGTVGWVGDANLVPRSKPKYAVALALAGQYMGSHFIMIDSGSGAGSPLPGPFISAVKNSIDIPLIIAGGARSIQDISAVAKAGADIVQVGTLIQSSKDIKRTVMKAVEALRKIKH
jgi:phosphoglycerol geranylgeranyltransferase